MLAVDLVRRTLSPWLYKSSPVSKHHSIANSTASSVSLSLTSLEECGMILLGIKREEPWRIPWQVRVTEAGVQTHQADRA